MNRVLVVDVERQPLMPCSPRRARLLLAEGKAAVVRRYPFTILLKREVSDVTRQPLRLKLDPGSRTTGLAILNDQTGEVVFAAELQHRGEQIKIDLLRRRAIRRNRRSRKTRYRQSRFLNRIRRSGWLPPSLESRVANVVTWVNRLRRVCPISAASLELVKFDPQALQNPEICGVEYQQGTLASYEVREYLLEKWRRRCAYCQVKHVPLEIEHLVPKLRGGSNRVSNLTLACRDCNQRKGNRTAEEFGHPELQDQAQRPLKDAAAVNSTRWALYRRITETGLLVETGTGGRTKYNRTRQGYPKAHWIDAACVGLSGTRVGLNPSHPVLMIQACGHGERQRVRLDRHGFPRGHKPRAKSFRGFRTGDHVRVQRQGAQRWIGRVAIRHRPAFVVQGRRRKIDAHPSRLCRVHRADGYAYS